ncbi:MAG: hypothetical protein IPN90_08955 [Elusimicrobia bacterium]|nr:hypothetical protein [Elusimicrobiota bacterium]
MKFHPFRRLTGAAVSLVYFAVNSALASAPETAFWTQRRQAAREKRTPSPLFASLPMAMPGMGPSAVGKNISLQSSSNKIPQEIAKTLPSSFFQENANILAALASADGTIRRIAMPHGVPPTKIILHVQDVHLNAAAQSNISALVTAVAARQAVEVVGLEGAFGPLDFSRYRAYPRRDTIREVARALLEKGDISGPIHAALSEESPPPATIGVDDAVHYRANVESYRTAAPLQVSALTSVENNQRRVERNKASVFSEELRHFDEKVAAYQDGRRSLGEHLQTLADLLPKQSSALTHFLETWNMEKRLDFDRAERDRRALLDRLVNALDKGSMEALAMAAVACRAGSLGHVDFYRQLKQLSHKAGVSVESFPALAEYIRYVQSSDRILPDELFQEMRSAEETAYARLAHTDAEKRLVAESRRLHLTKKLVEFSLTPEEWAEWETKKEGDMTPFEAFYREAQIRDDSMTRNFLGAMEKHHAKTGLLVTGGFHSAGMEEQFLKAGAAVISFTPRIDKIDTAQGSAYLNVFTREKTPLDRMFQGRTLFLTPPVYPETVRDGTAPLVAAALEAANGARNAADGSVVTTFKRLSSAPGAEAATLTTTRLPDNQVGVTVNMNGETTTLWVKLSPEGSRILAYNTVRPGEERTTERAKRVFAMWFSGEASTRWGHAFAGFMEWNFLSPTFVVQHHPTPPRMGPTNSEPALAYFWDRFHLVGRLPFRGGSLRLGFLRSCCGPGGIFFYRRRPGCFCREVLGTFFNGRNSLWPRRSNGREKGKGASR